MSTRSGSSTTPRASATTRSGSPPCAMNERPPRTLPSYRRRVLATGLNRRSKLTRLFRNRRGMTASGTSWSLASTRRRTLAIAISGACTSAAFASGCSAPTRLWDLPGPGDGILLDGDAQLPAQRCRDRRHGLLRTAGAGRWHGDDHGGAAAALVKALWDDPIAGFRHRGIRVES